MTQMDGIAGWAIGVMETLGGPGAALIVGLENLFPPIPSELILPLAGFAAGKGTLSLPAALLWTTAGSVIGAVLLYALGALFGRDRMRSVAARLPLVKITDLDKTEAWFARHGAKAVFFGRMIPVFRSLISLPAGIERMPFGVFLACTTLGSAVWNTIFVMSGYLLGQHWTVVEEYAGVFQWVVIGAVVLAIAWFIVVRTRQNAREPR